jgi:hypothetical protein
MEVSIPYGLSFIFAFLIGWWVIGELYNPVIIGVYSALPTVTTEKTAVFPIPKTPPLIGMEVFFLCYPQATF